MIKIKDEIMYAFAAELGWDEFMTPEWDVDQQETPKSSFFGRDEPANKPPTFNFPPPPAKREAPVFNFPPPPASKDEGGHEHGTSHKPLRPSELDPAQSEEFGESEWYNEEEEYDYEEEMDRRFESDMPDDEDLGYEHSPDERVGPEFTDEEILQMVDQDPVDVVMNKKLHLRPEYQKEELLIPMASNMADHIKEVKPDPGEEKLMQKERRYIVGLLLDMAKDQRKK